MEIPEKYTDAIRRNYPHLALDDVRLNRDGMNNDVVVINGKLACRFAKTDAAKRGLAQEVAVSKLLKGKISVRTPTLEQVSETFVSYEFINGVPLSRNQLLRFSLRNRQAVQAQLGDFLEQLHEITPEAAKAGVAESGASRTREGLLAFKERIVSIIFPKLWQHQRQWINEHFSALESSKVTLNVETGMIHGDLACYHVLCDPHEETLTGIIDFGTSGIGSQAIDAACLLDTYGESVVRQILMNRRYSEAMIDEARFRAGLLWLEWAILGIESNDVEMLLAHIGHSARDMLPIGMANE